MNYNFSDMDEEKSKQFLIFISNVTNAINDTDAPYPILRVAGFVPEKFFSVQIKNIPITTEQARVTNNNVTHYFTSKTFRKVPQDIDNSGFFHIQHPKTRFKRKSKIYNHVTTMCSR